MTAAMTEGAHPGEHVLSEAPGSISREQVTLAVGQGLLVDGTVLGKSSAPGGEYVVYDPTLVSPPTGAETAVATLYGNYDTTDDAQPAVVIARMAEVKTAQLAWVTGISSGEKVAAIAALATHYIIARS